MSAGFKRSLLERHQRRKASSGWRARLYKRFSEDIWRLDAQPLGWLARAGRRLGRLGFLTLSGFHGDRCLVRASALTYTTVLSLVPLLAVSFSVLKGLGYYEDFRRGTLERWLEDFAPSTGQQANDYAHGLRATFERVLTLVDSTDLRGLQAIGLVVVIWAVIRLLATIEAAFNEIWGVRRARSVLRKLTDYLAIVFVAPILLVVGIGLTTAASETRLAERLTVDWNLGPALDLLVKAMPLLLGWMAFSFVFLALPNTRTRVRSSLVGGLATALAWQAALALHLEFQIGVARFNAIYSTFAALPLFLIWVQLSWSIVLFGAELAYAVQHEGEFRRIVGWSEPTPGQRATLALRAVARVAAAFLSGTPARSAADLARELGVPSAPVEDVLQTLAGRGLVAASDDGSETTWLMARDPARISLAEVLEAQLQGAAGGDLPIGSALDRSLERLLGALDQERRGSAFNLSLQELVERAAQEAERSGAGSLVAGRAQQGGSPA